MAREHPLQQPAPPRMGLVASLLRVGDADEQTLVQLYRRRGIFKLIVGVLSVFSTLAVFQLRPEEHPGGSPGSTGGDLQGDTCPGTPALALQASSSALCFLGGVLLLATGCSGSARPQLLAATAAACTLTLRVFVLAAAQAAFYMACADQLEQSILLGYLLQDLIALLYVYFSVKGRSRLRLLQEGRLHAPLTASQQEVRW